MQEYRIFKKILTNYFKENDSATKKLIIAESEKTDHNFFRYFDNLLYHLGIISVHCELDLKSSNRYYPYLNFGKDNIFDEPMQIKKLTQFSITQTKAEEILANEIIKLLHFVNYEKLKNRINETLSIPSNR